MKVCLICFDFKESNRRLQPWRYFWEISQGMASVGIDVEIITDGYPNQPREEIMNGLGIHRLKRLHSPPFLANRELVGLVNRTKPDVILWAMGPTSFYFIPSINKVNIPVIALWTGTTYDLKNIIGLGYGEMVRNFRSIYGHAINSLIPPSAIKRVVSNPNVSRIIVLNQNNKEMIVNCDVPSNKVSVVPPGIGAFDLKPPEESETCELRKTMKLEDSDFVVLYIGSPLSLRGVDTLVTGASIACRKIPSLRLILLSRRREHELKREEGYIQGLCVNLGIDDKTDVVSAFLSRGDIKNYIGISDVVVLPFKLVQSDTPISILEVMALGKPLISTRLDGIPELLAEGRGIVINPNDPQALADALSSLYSGTPSGEEMGGKARAYMLRHPKWEETTRNVVDIINETIK